MSENKGYISQPQENGSVLISEDVIASITTVAVKEVEGVCGLYGSFGKKNSKGLKLTLKDRSVDIECNIIALYGHPVMEIAKNVQTAVVTAVESMTGLTVDSINVNVCGISTSNPT